MLDAANFDVPLVHDPKQTRAFFNNMLITLDQITDYIYEDLHQSSPGLKRSDVWSEVWQDYSAKQIEHEQQPWQVVIQALYTPQYNFWSSQRQASPWQNSFQLSLGANHRSHLYGDSGWEQTLQVNGSFFNAGSGNLDWFQNALLSYQASYVSPLGHEFRFLGVPDLWGYLQGSVFAQIAAGAGTNWDTDASGRRQVYVGFLVQPSVGGQLSLNVGAMQIIVQGSVVYSWLSSTNESGSKPSSSWGGQLGLGIGAQF